MSLDNPIVFMAVVFVMCSLLTIVLLALQWRHAMLLFWASLAMLLVWAGIVFSVFAFAEGGASG